MTEIVDNKIQIQNEEIAALTTALTQLMSRTEMLENTVKRYGSADFKSEERARIERLEIQQKGLLNPFMAGRTPYTVTSWQTSATLNNLG